MHDRCMLGLRCDMHDRCMLGFGDENAMLIARCMLVCVCVCVCESRMTIFNVPLIRLRRKTQ